MPWLVEIRRIGIANEISLLSSHNAYPSDGHLETVLHVIGYLNIKHKSRLYMDPNYPPINEDNFKSHDWKAFYGDVQGDIPVNAPAPRGKVFVIRMMLDSDDAEDGADRSYRTSYMIYVKKALID